MAACGSLQHIFEKPLSHENTNLFDSLSSWKRISSTKSSSTGHLDDSSSPSSSSSSFAEIFGELHFKETPSSPSSSSSSASSSVLTDVSSQVSAVIDKNNKNPTTDNFLPTNKTRQYRHSDSFSSMNSESLSMCTEGLGFESCDDVEDSKSDVDNPSTTHWRPHHRHHHVRRTSCIKHTQAEYLSSGESKRSRISGVEFPPPISCIGRTGKPWVCFKSYRTNGRFILKEVRIPTQEFLHACREDGRLKLQFIQSDDEKFDDDEEEEEESVDLNVSNEENDNNGAHDDNQSQKEENDAEKDEKRGESS